MVILGEIIYIYLETFKIVVELNTKHMVFSVKLLEVIEFLLFC